MPINRKITKKLDNSKPPPPELVEDAVNKVVTGTDHTEEFDNNKTTGPIE